MTRFAMFLGLGLAAIVQAQDQCLAFAKSIPPCAVAAIESAAAGVGCGPTDFSCQCVASNSQAINTVAFSSVLETCGAVTGLAVKASASAVCACAASATSLEASTTGSSRSARSILSTSLTSIGINNSAAPTTTPVPSLPTTSTAASATTEASSARTASGGTTLSSAAHSSGAAAKTIISIGGCLSPFIAILVASWLFSEPL